jgi:glyoxylase-like metal-dependent hydrolase (beta-lactamase superfamily II)
MLEDPMSAETGTALPALTRRALVRRTLSLALAAPVAGVALDALGAAPASAIPTGGPPWAPVPPAGYAGFPTIPDTGLLVEELGHGVFAINDGGYSMMVAVHRTGVIVVDAPVSFGDRLLEAIRLISNKPITHVVYSHAHVDHTGGAYRYPKSACYVAHEETRFLLERARDSRRPVPTRSFTGRRRHTLAVGGQVLHLDYYGANHQVGELFIYAPRARALMHVDLVFPGWAPLKNLAIAADVPGFVQALDTTLRYTFDHLVAGHFRLGTRDDVELTRAYMRDLIAAAAEANNTVDTAAAEAAAMEQNPGNVWAAVNANFDAVAQRTVELMPDRWLSELGAADVFLLDNAFVVSESQRVDGDPLVGSHLLRDWRGTI